MTRRYLRAICRALIGVVLLAQLAVSAYACPELSPALRPKMEMAPTAAPDREPTGATMAVAVKQALDCEGMAGPTDPTFGNLCAEHCHHGQQSDLAATLTVPAALLTALYVTPPVPGPVVASGPASTGLGALAATSSSLAILHCCFRL